VGGRDHLGRQVNPAWAEASGCQVGRKPSRPAPDVPDAGAETHGPRQITEQAKHRLLSGHPVQGAGQAIGVKLGEHVVCSPQLIGLGIHERP
jgi:hypothetical protein